MDHTETRSDGQIDPEISTTSSTKDPNNTSNEKEDENLQNFTQLKRPQASQSRGRRTTYAVPQSPVKDKSAPVFRRRQSSPASSTSSSSNPASTSGSQTSNGDDGNGEQKRRVMVGGQRVLPMLPAGGVKLRRSASRRPASRSPNSSQVTDNGVALKEVDEGEDGVGTGGGWGGFIMGTIVGAVVVAGTAAGGWWYYNEQLKEGGKQRNE